MYRRCRGCCFGSARGMWGSCAVEYRCPVREFVVDRAGCDCVSNTLISNKWVEVRKVCHPKGLVPAAKLCGKKKNTQFWLEMFVQRPMITFNTFKIYLTVCPSVPLEASTFTLRWFRDGGNVVVKAITVVTRAMVMTLFTSYLFGRTRAPRINGIFRYISESFFARACICATNIETVGVGRAIVVDSIQAFIEVWRT